MVNFAKTAVLLMAVAVASAIDDGFNLGLHVATDTNAQIALPQTLTVNYPADVATPIRYSASDYNGPYDPRDPDGTMAAHHRAAKLHHQQNIDQFKSYVPTGLGELAKREFVKLAKSEGKRFAFAHPKEAGQILDIMTKAKRLCQNAEDNMMKADKDAVRKKGRRN